MMADTEEQPKNSEGTNASDANSDEDMLKKGVGTTHPDDVYPMRFITIPVPAIAGFGGGEIYMNWFTSFFGFVFLWGFAAYW